MSTSAVATETVRVRISDPTGQKMFRAPSIPVDVSIGHMVQALLTKMGLAQVDAEGRPLSFRCRLAREARFLRSHERVGECLSNDDELTLSPDIQAG